MQVWKLPRRSLETSSSLLYSIIPFMGPSLASCTAWQISLIGGLGIQLRGEVHHRNIIGGHRSSCRSYSPSAPVITRPTALAAPVVEGMMLLKTERRCASPPGVGVHRLCLEVEAWMVDMSARRMPNCWWMTLVRGARQLVVQLHWRPRPWWPGSYCFPG